MERISRNLILKPFLSGLERFASFSHFTAGTHQASDLPVWINGAVRSVNSCPHSATTPLT